MKKSALVMALLAMTVVVSCKKHVKATPQPPVPTQPPPAPAPTSTPAPQLSRHDQLMKMSADELDRQGLLAEVHFDYDKADIRDADKSILAKNAELLKGDLDFVKVTVEGHCDERGSVEYNLALGERRAKAAYDHLVSLGVPADRLRTVSYGKEVSLCSEKSEDCLARNRRAHSTITEKIKK